MGLLLLGIWAIAAGLIDATNFELEQADLILPLLLIAAGILIVLGYVQSRRVPS